MASPWLIWIVVVGAPVIALLVGMIARRIARSRSGLDRKEMAVLRRAAGRSPYFFADGGTGLGLPVLAAACFAYYQRRAALKKVVGFNPRKQNRKEGVIFAFYELRVTRTELIKGYGTGALRIPLQGLTAAITNTATVTIEGPGTKFAYRRGADDPRRARQFAALLNYEASLRGAPQ
jgi:hypothetical protein